MSRAGRDIFTTMEFIGCGVKIEKINGDEGVKSLDLVDMGTHSRGKLDVDGILVHAGRAPNIGFIDGLVPLDKDGYIIVNNQMETQVAGIFAAGDVRCCSPMQIISASGDGAATAVSVIKRLASS